MDNAEFEAEKPLESPGLEFRWFSLNGENAPVSDTACNDMRSAQRNRPCPTSNSVAKKASVHSGNRSWASRLRVHFSRHQALVPRTIRKAWKTHQTWFRKIDGCWPAVEIVNFWHLCACVPFLTFLRDKMLGYIKPGVWSPESTSIHRYQP